MSLGDLGKISFQSPTKRMVAVTIEKRCLTLEGFIVHQSEIVFANDMDQFNRKMLRRVQIEHEIWRIVNVASYESPPSNPPPMIHVQHEEIESP